MDRGPEERRVQAGGVALSCRIWEGKASPILAIHGLASNARWWDLVARELSSCCGVHDGPVAFILRSRWAASVRGSPSWDGAVQLSSGRLCGQTESCTGP